MQIGETACEETGFTTYFLVRGCLARPCSHVPGPTLVSPPRKLLDTFIPLAQRELDVASEIFSCSEDGSDPGPADQGPRDLGEVLVSGPGQHILSLVRAGRCRGSGLGRAVQERGEEGAWVPPAAGCAGQLQQAMRWMHAARPRGVGPVFALLCPVLLEPGHAQPLLVSNHAAGLGNAGPTRPGGHPCPGSRLCLAAAAHAVWAGERRGRGGLCTPGAPRARGGAAHRCCRCREREQPGRHAQVRRVCVFGGGPGAACLLHRHYHHFRLCMGQARA